MNPVNPTSAIVRTTMSLFEVYYVLQMIAEANGFKLTDILYEKQVAVIFKVDLSTMKRTRQAGLLQFPTRHGVDGVRYLGLHVAKRILWGDEKWPSIDPFSDTSLENTGLDSEPSLPVGTGAGLSEEGLNALRSALLALRKPSDGSKNGS